MILGHGQVAGRLAPHVPDYVEDLVEAVRREVWAGATLETKDRVRDAGAEVRAALTREGGTYRPWRTSSRQRRRAYQMVS
jgi:hypothetical protein